METSILEDALQTLNDSVLILDLKGSIIECNKSTKRFYGYEEKELQGKLFSSLSPASRATEFISIRDTVLLGVRVDPFETERMTRTGDILKVVASFSLIKNVAGKISGISCIERKISVYDSIGNKALALLENAPDAMVIVNNTGIIQLVNSQAEKMFGFHRDEMKGNPIEILLPQRYQYSHDQDRMNFFNSPKVRPMGEGLELFGKRKDGEEFPVEISLSPLDTEQGVLVSAAIRDISERKYIRELENKNRELEQFAYIASHDLQEPLDTIASFILLLQDGKADKLDPEALNYLDYIKNSSDRLRLLITGLLEYSRLGKKSRKERSDCNILLNEVLMGMDSSIKNNNAIIRSEKLPNLSVYPVELRLLLQNLISNGIKFCRENLQPEINISCKKENRHYKFCVEDNGIGIDERYKDKVFIIFQRLHNDRYYKGSGIGLAHCKKIVELHGGKIWLKSFPGKGTRIYFTIPVEKGR